MDPLVRFSGALAALSLSAMVVVLAATLVLRPLGILVPSSEEIVTFLMVAMAFFGITYTNLERAHVRVDTLHRRLPATVRHGVELASHLGAAVLTDLNTLHSQIGRQRWLHLRRQLSKTKHSYCCCCCWD